VLLIVVLITFLTAVIVLTIPSAVADQGYVRYVDAQPSGVCHETYVLISNGKAGLAGGGFVCFCPDGNGTWACYRGGVGEAAPICGTPYRLSKFEPDGCGIMDSQMLDQDGITVWVLSRDLGIDNTIPTLKFKAASALDGSISQVNSTSPDQLQLDQDGTVRLSIGGRMNGTDDGASPFSTRISVSEDPSAYAASPSPAVTLRSLDLSGTTTISASTVSQGSAFTQVCIPHNLQYVLIPSYAGMEDPYGWTFEGVPKDALWHKITWDIDFSESPIASFYLYLTGLTAGICGPNDGYTCSYSFDDIEVYQNDVLIASNNMNGNWTHNAYCQAAPYTTRTSGPACQSGLDFATPVHGGSGYSYLTTEQANRGTGYFDLFTIGNGGYGGSNTVTTTVGPLSSSGGRIRISVWVRLESYLFDSSHGYDLANVRLQVGISDVNTVASRNPIGAGVLFYLTKIRWSGDQAPPCPDPVIRVNCGTGIATPYDLPVWTSKGWSIEGWEYYCSPGGFSSGAPVTGPIVRAQSLDSAVFSPKATGSGLFTTPEYAGIYAAPTIAPDTSSGATVEITNAYGVYADLIYSSANMLGFFTPPNNAYSIYADEPGIGTSKYAIGAKGNVGILSGTSASQLQLFEPSGSGTNYTGFKSPALAANVLYSLPTADGTSGQALSTNGSKVMGWTSYLTGTGAGTTGAGTGGSITKWTGTGPSSTLGNSTATDDGTTFSINKRTAMPQVTVALVDGNNNNLNVGDSTYVRFTCADANYNPLITGIAGGTDGRVLYLENFGCGDIQYCQHGSGCDATSDPPNHIQWEQPYAAGGFYQQPSTTIVAYWDTHFGSGRWLLRIGNVIGFGTKGKAATWDTSTGASTLKANWLTDAPASVLFSTKDSVGADIDRLLLTGGADQSSVNITDADLNLGGNNISNVGSVTATTFDGSLTGTATTALSAWELYQAGHSVPISTDDDEADPIIRLSCGTGLDSVVCAVTNATLSSGTGGMITATTAGALAANGANCSAGSFPLGVNASGAVESCVTISGGAGIDVTGDGSSGIDISLDATVPRVLYTLTSSDTDATTGEVSIIDAGGVGTRTLPADFLTIGKTIRITLYGVFSTAAGSPPNLTLKFYYGTTAVADSGATAMTAGVTNQQWEADLVCTTRTIGSGGTHFCQGDAHFHTSHGASLELDLENTAAVSVSTTGTLAVDMKATWSSSGQSITTTNAIIEALN
jgi:hypothetical protein